MVGIATSRPPAYLGGKHGRPSKENGYFSLSLTSIYCLFEVISVKHHASWSDELQIWMLARHSHSIPELLYLKRYEGHPDLWYVLVYYISRVTANPAGMQILHLLIACITVFIVSQYAPFTRLQKVLFAFGYFTFFEYAAISRNYALGVLFVFAFCAVYRTGPQKRYALLSIFLSLLAQTNVYGLIIAVALLSIMLGEIVSSASPREFIPPGSRQAMLPAALLVGAICFSCFSMWPPADAGLDFTRKPLLYTVTMISRSFIPIPRITLNFWNSNILHTPELAILSIALVVISVCLFLRRPPVLIGYCLGTCALFLFKYFVHFGFLRHDGHAFVLFLACLWIYSSYPNRPMKSPRLNAICEWCENHRDGALTGLLGVQVIGGVIASALAFSAPFSRGQDVAHYMTAKHIEKMFIVGDVDNSASTIAAYLDRDIFYLRGNRQGSYILWDRKRLAQPAQTAIGLAKQKAVERKQDVVVLLNYPLDLTALDPDVTQLAFFGNAVEVNENYYLYLIRYKPSVRIDRLSSQRFPDIEYWAGCVSHVAPS
jgi:hypothetical protein